MPTIVLGTNKGTTYRLTYTVTKVAVKEDSSVAKYRKNVSDEVDTVISGLKNKALWFCTFEFDAKKLAPKRVSDLTFPDLSPRKGHVHGKGWKYHIDKGRGSEDRLMVDSWSASIKNISDPTAGKLKNTMELTCNVEISITVSAEDSTHS